MGSIIKLSNGSNKFLQCYALPIGLLALIVLMQIFNPRVPLFSLLNLKNILMQTTAVTLAALGLSYIMISGEGDMSFSGMFSMLSVTFVMVANATDSFWTGFAVALCVALVVNLMISQMVTRLGFSSFIVSIAVMFMANGVEKALHQQTTLLANPLHKSFAQLELGLPVIVWVMVILYVVSFFVIGRTRFGFHLRVVGENKNAGIEAGMNPAHLKVAAYMIAALLLAIAATIEGGRVGAIYEQGKNYMLPIFAACYLGSSMYVPGRVNVVGTLTGALFMGVIDNFMKMMNVESFIIPIAQGVILVLSVAAASYKTRGKIQQVKV